MNGYELRDHRGEQIFRAIGGYFANFSSSVNRISEEIYSRQAVYLSFTDSLPVLSNIWVRGYCGIFCWKLFWGI
jgi:hypothetical protein